MGYTFIVQDAPDLTIPEDTICRARLNGLEKKTISWNDRQTGEAKTTELMEWSWEVISGNHQGRKVRGTCDAVISNHPRNKFRLWAEAILDKRIDSGEPFDTDDLVGQIADVSIGHRPDKKDPSKKFEFVDEVIPISGGLSSQSEPPF